MGGRDKVLETCNPVTWHTEEKQQRPCLNKMEGKGLPVLEFALGPHILPVEPAFTTRMCIHMHVSYIHKIKKILKFHVTMYHIWKKALDIIVLEQETFQKPKN